MSISTAEIIKTGVDTFDVNKEFKNLISYFAVVLSNHGLQTKAYHSPSDLVRFNSKDLATRMHIYNSFRNYVDICDSAFREGGDLRNDSIFLWSAFKKFKLRPSSDLMAYLEKQDVIEIYDSSYVQIFRNLRFFEICSYTLLELLTEPFSDLYYRDHQITMKIIGILSDCFAEKIKTTTQVDVADHEAGETRSERMNKYIIHQKVISPLRDSTGAVSAIFSNFEILSQS